MSRLTGSPGGLGNGGSNTPRSHAPASRLSFTSAYSGTLHLYAIDWDSTTRRQSITVDDGSGPRTATLGSDFSQGAWIHIPISVASGGTLTITVNRTAGANAVLSGLFLG